MDKIIGIGNALVDVLVRLDDDEMLRQMGLPKGGMQLITEEKQLILSDKMRGMNPRQATGGSAGNAMLALANLNAKPGFVGKIGRDEMGRFFARNCLETGIEARLLGSDNHTGVANTFISADGERTFGTCLGAAALMSAGEISPQLFRGYQLLHIEGYLVQNHDLVETICRVARGEGLRLSIDLASYNVVRDDLPFFRHLVQDYVDIVFANEEESAAFCGGKRPAEALEEIASMTDIAVVKLGSRGASAMRGKERVSVPARRVEVVDTTAAGDFFAGGFLYALTRGASLRECLHTGACLSEHVIQVVGTHLPEATWAAIRQRVSGLCPAASE